MRPMARHDDSTRTFADMLEAKNGTPSLVVIRGPQLGRQIPLDRMQLTLGRSSNCDIVIGHEGVSRVHCQFSFEGRAVRVCDHASKNGTWLRGERISAAEGALLVNGDVLHIGDASFKFLDGSDTEAAYHEAVYRMMTEDALTQVKNRRFLLDVLEREVARERRGAQGLALLLADVDEFKRINDEHGHVFGDYVLRQVATVLSRATRRNDCLARYGGDEFAVVLTDGSRAGAEIFGERVRGAVEHERFELDGKSRVVTISIGVAVFSPELGTPAALLEAADVALYAAKGGGRNRVAS